MLRLASLAVAAVLAAPPVAAVAATPSPTTLRAAMADPVESGFLEYIEGSSSLEGQFDANGYADIAGDAPTRSRIVAALDEYGFVVGFGRDFWKPASYQQMEEILMVFRTAEGAQATAASSRGGYVRDQRFAASFDPGLSAGAYGVTESEDGYFWSIVVFTKGNQMFAVERGSDETFPTAAGLAQARKAYSVAPGGFDVTTVAGGASPVAARPAAVRRLDVRPFLVAGMAGMLVLAAAIGVALFVAFMPRSTAEGTPGSTR